MNVLSMEPNKNPCSRRPDDSRGDIRLGFVAETIVDLLHLDAAPLYSECLARMTVAESVLLTASDFVGDLEAQGVIGLLDAAIVDLVLDALADDLHIRLGCNISPRTLADRAAWNNLVRRIGARSALAARLTLEVTESAPLDDIPEAAARLREARALGCRLAVDDFGAGFATSAYLRGLDIQWDLVKIDRACFGDMRKTPSKRDGLRSLVGLAACFAPVVVVEGIETRQHLAAARDAGAHYGQGWIFDGAVRERWTAPGVVAGAQLAGAMMAGGATLRPWAGGLRHGASSNGPDRKDVLLSRVNGLGDRVRMLVARAWTGGAI